MSKRIKIEWQRLIIDQATCPRCGGTEQEIETAVKGLKRKGIAVKLSKKEISKAEFDKNPQESNRILINGRTIEDWLTAKTGSSCCCDACGDAECRTVEVNEQVYETIPAELIVKAALEALKKEAE